MTESESVALPFGDSAICDFRCLCSARYLVYNIFRKNASVFYFYLLKILLNWLLPSTPQCQAQFRFAEVRSRASYYKIGFFPPLRNAKLNSASRKFARVLRTIKIEMTSWKKKGHLFPRRPFYFCIAQLYLEH